MIANREYPQVLLLEGIPCPEGELLKMAFTIMNGNYF
jgi:hypothetical protein